MKWIFMLMLAINIGFGVFVFLRENVPDPDAQLVALQMNAEKIQIVPPRPAPAPTPVTTSPRAVCMEWGSFSAGEVARAQRALDRLALGARTRRTEVGVTAGYWVFVRPLRSQAAMERKAAELRALGVEDYYPVLDQGRWRYAISLGVFRSEEGATRYLAQLRQRGVRSAIVGEREQRVTQNAFVISEPTEEESGKLADLRNQFPGSELRGVECR